MARDGWAVPAEGSRAMAHPREPGNTKANRWEVSSSLAPRPDDEPPGLPPEWAGFVVPDDISELDPEVALLRSETPAQPTPGLLRRLVQTRRWQRYGVSGPLVVIVLLAVAFVASLVFLLLPSTPRPPQVRPLANPRVGPGRPGGLLPDLALPVGVTDAVRLRNLRPAVIVLLPAGCDCTTLVSDVITSTSTSRLQVLLVGQVTDPVLARTTPTNRVRAGTDSGGRLASTYGLAGQPVAVFVRSDGTVSRVLRGAGPGAELHAEIAGLAG